MAMVVVTYGYEYRSPARAEPDGVFQPQGRNAGDYRARGGLRAGRPGHLGPGRKCAAYWNRGRSKIACKRALHARAQHRAGAADRRCAFQLEDYGALTAI